MSWDILTQISSLPPEQQDGILNGPAMPPPANMVSNLQNPPNSNTLALATITISLIVVTFAVLLRAYVKVFIYRKLFLEDALAFVGFSMVLAYVYCSYRVLHQVGFLIHQWDISVRNLYDALYVGNMATSFYLIAISTLKVAILLEWNKIFAPNHTPKSFYWICYILLWVNIIYYVITVVFSNIVCFPTMDIIDKSNPSLCLNKAIAEGVSATINLVSHILIFALPQRIIWNLHMTIRKKIGVSLVFAFGLLVVVTGVCRLSATMQYFTSKDVIYIGYKVYLWCVAELTFVVLVFCAPVIPRIVSKETQVNKTFELSLWSRLFTGRSRTSKVPTQVDIERHPAASDNTYERIEEIGNPPLRDLELRNGNWNTQVVCSAGQLHADRDNSPPLNNNQGGILRTVYIETCEERCNDGTAPKHHDSMRS
ncbi:uncharacterized protein F4807DRAFT_203029 [Annulohypoxylon truncatum]|uniref:uncharacterized protein n=1 Tax=Annulohypoxylon truncatum TaxID=327061 RepID=UPI002007B9B9|nr:uncharacterized protein F4807DRAFT_203029 [Annulohypoxylon truncatum]KAI1213862.1 hypothetical protein F4807DRAFT_203029 [Annulohypoxylon truncatum]